MPRVLNQIARMVAAAAVVALSSAASADDQRPNIIFIMTDDHANEALSAYSGRINHTPHMDRIAEEGMRFDRAYVGNSICGPSRATLLTGTHSHINGMIGNVYAQGVPGSAPFDGAQPTFPQIMQANGYETAIIGKWHLMSDPTGFDHWEILIGQGPYYNPTMRYESGQRSHEGYTTDIITDLSLEWLENRADSDKPFVLLKHHKAPHRNWKPGPDHLTKYDDVLIPEPATLFDDYSGRTRAAELQTQSIADDLNANDLKLDTRLGHLTDEQRRAWHAAYGPRNEAFRAADLDGRALLRWKYQRYIKDYLRTIASVDDNIGRLLNYLDESGLAENTIVIYTSDQGFYLGEHGWYDKRFMYEPSFRTPLLVRWPGQVEPGTVNDDLVMNLDFAQTFLDIADLEAPDRMQGRSLLPLLRGTTPEDWRESIYYHYYANPDWHTIERHYGVRTDQYKLMHFYEQDEWEFYDLQRDPHELASAYDDPTYAQVIEELKHEIDRLQDQYGDRYSTQVDFPTLWQMSREQIEQVAREGVDSLSD